MPDIKEHIEYLSQEVGPHPSGTEEEQKAALYITEQFQKEADLPAAIEDFSGVADPEIPRMIYGGIAVLFALLELLVPGLGAVWFVGALVGAGLLVAEILGHPLLASVLGKGVSQNVVAKYIPGSDDDASGRKRKVVIVAHYDTGKVRQELTAPFVQFMPIVNKAVLAAIVAMPILLLLKNAVGASGGFLASILMFLVVVALILSVVPVALGALHRSAAYSEGANSNSSGVAALLDVATRVGRGRMSEAELLEREEALMHGEAEAYDSGLVPEGAEFVYSSGSEEDLNAAKAAIAALSGKPVSGMSPEDVERNLDMLNARAEEEARQMKAAEESRAYDADVYDAEESEDQQPQEVLTEQENIASQPVPELIEEVETSEAIEAPEPALEQKPAPSVPDWFKKAQEKAKKPTKREKPAQRSQYAAVFDAVSSEGTGMFAQAAADAGREVQAAARAAQQEVESVRSSQYEVHAPRWNTAGLTQENEETQKEVPSAATDQTQQETAIQQTEVPEESAAGTAVMKAASLAENENVEATEGPSEPTATNASSVEDTIAGNEGDSAASSRALLPGGGLSTSAAQQREQMMQAEPNAAAQAKYDVPVVPVSADPSATMATPPIDVSKFRVDAGQPASSIPMPSFLDPQKVQAEKMANNPAARRTGNRVDATDARITSLGVVDQQTLVAENVSAQNDVQPAASEISSAVPFSAGVMNDARDGSRQSSSRRPILLPNIGSGEKQQVISKSKQRAPLADVESSGKTAAKSLLRTLPSIGSADVAQTDSSADSSSEDAANPAKGNTKNSSLLVSLPSLSGAIKAADSAQDQAAAAAQASIGTAGATGAFAPVTDELVKNASLDDDSDDLYIDDVDDSEYDTDFTQTGAIAGPGYVEMPRSRFRRFLDKFRHEKDEDEIPTQDWLDVDDQFEAQAVGRARGGWESFQDESYSQHGHGSKSADEAALQAAPSAQDGSEAYAGATQAFPPYSQIDQDAYQGFSARPNEQASAQIDDFDIDEGDEGEQGRRQFRQWHGGAFSLRRMENGDLDSEEISAVAAASAEGDTVIDEELEQIYKFRNPEIKTEVWFVALGSELSGNAGIKAFLAEHEHELKGSFVVEIDSFGGGDLSLIDVEGDFKPSKPSSRMKRYLRKASQATGVKLASAPILWQESAASYATKHGHQAVHLVGMQGGKPAGYAEASDIVENVDMRKVKKNAGFVLELLKNI